MKSKKTKALDPLLDTEFRLRDWILKKEKRMDARFRRLLKAINSRHDDLKRDHFVLRETVKEFESFLPMLSDFRRMDSTLMSNAKLQSEMLALVRAGQDSLRQDMNDLRYRFHMSRRAKNGT